jgi:hypothetical protein
MLNVSLDFIIRIFTQYFIKIRIKNFNENIFGSINILTLLLHQFFKTLIKKGGGNLPDEAFATLLVLTQLKEGANSNSVLQKEISQSKLSYSST